MYTPEHQTNKKNSFHKHVSAAAIIHAENQLA